MVSLKYHKIYTNFLASLYQLEEKNNTKSDISKLVAKIDDEYVKEKLKLIEKHLYDKSSAVTVLEQMPLIMLYPDNEVKQRLSFVYNSSNLYAVMFCLDNSYSWCSYNKQNNVFSDKKEINFNPKVRETTEDSVIRNIIDSTYRQDIIKFAQIQNDDCLEKRIEKLKKLNINSSGYRIL